jgi:hypothetical protein
LQYCDGGLPGAGGFAEGRTIAYNDIYDTGVIVLGDDGICYVIDNPSYDYPNIVVQSEHGSCQECLNA